MCGPTSETTGDSLTQLLSKKSTKVNYQHRACPLMNHVQRAGFDRPSPRTALRAPQYVRGYAAFAYAQCHRSHANVAGKHHRRVE
jgi:hypothetical protein